MKVTTIELEAFKGVRSGVYDFHDFLNEVCGPNGCGKTTLVDAWLWLWSDKNYDLLSNPDVRPTFMEECVSSVTAYCDVNNKNVKFRKYQVDLRTKKQKEQDAPVRISNKYEINDVPKTQKDFFKDVETMGIDVENFLLLSHTDILMQMKVADRRKVIFALAGEVTDLDVAKTIPECSKVAEMLAEYKADEIVAMQKATVKRCKDQVESIPDQIIGMEKSKVEIDPDLNKKIAACNAEIEELTELVAELTAKADVGTFNAKAKELDVRKNEIFNNANAERLENQRKAHEALDAANNALLDAKRKLNSIESSGSNLNQMYLNANALMKRLTAELEDLKKAEFKYRDKCPTCGQMIPKAEVEKAKANWQKSQNARIKELEDRLRAVTTQFESYKAEGKALGKQKKDAEKAVADAEAKVSECKTTVESYAVPVTPDFADIDAQIAELETQKAACSQFIIKKAEAEDKLRQKKAELNNLNRQTAAVDYNANIDARIEEEKTALRGYAQSKADAEAILYQMQLISQKKNEMLSDQVNSHFSRVKFRLFAVQKNGEIKDDCTPLVLCSDGEFRDMTYSANTAAIVAAKLDICVGLQKFYGQELPIWLDGAECFDGENRKMLMLDRQLILLCVSDDERMVVK
jgi:chromosome segregation ATPase